MDMLSLLMNAKVMDEDGDEIGEVVGFTINGGKMMLSTDIDTELPPNALNFVSDNIHNDLYLAAEDSKIQKEIINGGLIAVHTSMHMFICGFNESLKGWGFEDIDYKLRLESTGMHFYEIPDKMYCCLDHPDDDRIRCYEDKKDVSWDKNRQAALKLWQSPTFGQWASIEVTDF